LTIVIFKGRIGNTQLILAFIRDTSIGQKLNHVNVALIKVFLGEDGIIEFK
jgi:hypothetical protein